MPYKAYLASSLSVREDHHAIFVETDDDHSGYLFHVVGSIREGMRFGHRPSRNPKESPLFVSEEYLGTVSNANFHQIESIVNAVEPPKKQFGGMKRINPREPLRACQEWAADAATSRRTFHPGIPDWEDQCAASPASPFVFHSGGTDVSGNRRLFEDRE
ncbi:hypothetical protein EV356DRAFT_565600 [Viridothelium virens]|uniref:Uncharacterized protein n=1 Tax=Viridothelium virens TaxID=1048519 RepID=A0A6A6HET9_VIRVR|nr:hypothetical protein EV356DRAFT_565600 [Viridothelium virens]